MRTDGAGDSAESRTKRRWLPGIVAAVGAVLVGLVFGAGAMALMRGFGQGEGGGGVLWLLVHLTSGNWGWTLVAVVATWLLSRRSALMGWRRWLWCWALTLLLLVATATSWYGSAAEQPNWVFTVVGTAFICAPIAACIGLVTAFLHAPGRLGLLARLCLPAGLALPLLADPPFDSADPSSDAVVGVWWAQLALSILWVAGVAVSELRTARSGFRRSDGVG